MMSAPENMLQKIIFHRFVPKRVPHT